MYDFDDKLVEIAPCMNKVAFDVFMAGFRCGETTRRALEKIYVGRQKRQHAITETGVKEDTLNKALPRFEEKIRQDLISKQLVRREYVFPELACLVLDALEETYLSGKAPASLEDIMHVYLANKGK